MGPRKQTALLLTLARAGFEPEQLGLALAVPFGKADELRQELSVLAASEPPDAVELAGLVESKLSEKYDLFLDEEQLCLAYAGERIDAGALPGLAAEVLQDWPERALEAEAGRAGKVGLDAR